MTPSLKAARAMAVLAPILSFFAWLTMLLMSCFKMATMAWTTCSILLGIAFLTEGMTFIVFNQSDCKVAANICRTGSGGSVAIAAAILLFLSFLASALVFAPTQAMFEFDLGDILINKSNEHPETKREAVVETDSRDNTKIKLDFGVTENKPPESAMSFGAV